MNSSKSTMLSEVSLLTSASSFCPVLIHRLQMSHVSHLILHTVLETPANEPAPVQTAVCVAIVA